MQELIQSLQTKLGLSGDQANEAASHFVEFIKSKLPESLHGHIDSALAGGAGSGISGEGSGLVENIKEKAEGFISGIADKFKL